MSQVVEMICMFMIVICLIISFVALGEPMSWAVYWFFSGMALFGSIIMTIKKAIDVGQVS
jgi:hypothetical protein